MHAIPYLFLTLNLYPLQLRFTLCHTARCPLSFFMLGSGVH
jgi:hypothetical protein